MGRQAEAPTGEAEGFAQGDALVESYVQGPKVLVAPCLSAAHACSEQSALDASTNTQQGSMPTS